MSTDDVIVARAKDPDGRRRNRLEVYGRRWAQAQGVPVPRVVDHDPDGGWFISERVRFLPPVGSVYVDAAFEAAARIAAGTPPVMPEPATTWRNPDRWRVPVRAVQLAAAGVSPSVFVAARGAAASLPAQVPSHCDFHTGNVLLTKDVPEEGPRIATIIDFEYLRMGPAHADEIRLLTTLPSHEDAAYALGLLLDRTTAADWPALATQLRWLALRPFAELVTVAGGPDPAQLDLARERWRLGQRWAEQIEQAGRSGQPRDSLSFGTETGGRGGGRAIRDRMLDVRAAMSERATTRRGTDGSR